MKKKTNKQLLFERMKYLNPEFKEPIAEAINIPNAIEKVRSGFNINDWDSEEGQQSRQQIASGLKDLYMKVVNTLKSSVSDEEKQKAVKILLTGSAYAAVLVAIWKGLHPDMVPLVDKEFSMLGKDFDLEFGTRPEFSGALKWGKIALFLFITRFVHGLLVKGRNFKENVKNTWNSIKNMFVKQNESWSINESSIYGVGNRMVFRG
jgi:hypothetical protein